MKIIIAGGRDITDMELVKKAIIDSGFDITECVCGAAKGVDTLGANYCRGKNIPVKMFPANWALHNKAAGPIRNKQMADYADALILVWDGTSRGSSNMLQTMMKLNKPVFQIRKVIKELD